MYKWLCEQHGSVILSIGNSIIPGGDANGYLNDVFPFQYLTCTKNLTNYVKVEREGEYDKRLPEVIQYVCNYQKYIICIRMIPSDVNITD